MGFSAEIGVVDIEIVRKWVSEDKPDMLRLAIDQVLNQTSNWSCWSV